MLTNCLTKLAQCGYPHPGNTGVPAGTVLTSQGGVTISTAGTVLDGRLVNGSITVNAANVTIRNSKIVGRVQMGSVGSLTIQDTMIDCVTNTGTGLAGRNFTALRLHVLNCENAFDVNGNNLIQDTYITGVREVAGGHGDGIQNYTPSGSSNIVIRHNTFDLVNPITSSIITWPAVGGLVVEFNFLMSGAYSLYCPEDPVSQATVRGNRFFPAKTGDPHSAAFGLTDECNDPRITWSGNYRDNDLSAVNV